MGPLAGVTVLELAGIGPGPFAAMMLADMGASVLRVDRPAVRGHNPEYRLGYDPMNRGRPTLEVDLKSPQGVAKVKSLVARADVLIEGFRPGVTERLGLGPEQCAAINPKLVYGRMTGWGQDGPLAPAAGHDINYIALTGLLHSIGTEGSEPVIPINLLGDYAGGALYLAFGIACALFEARASGRGQVIDAAIVDGASSLMTLIFALRSQGMWSDRRGTNLLDGGRPWYGVYQTADGRYASVGALEEQFYVQLTTRMGFAAGELPDRADPRNWAEIRRHFADKFRSRTLDEWCALLEGHDTCFAPVLSMQEAPLHRHMKARAGFETVEGVTVPAPAPRFSRTAPRALTEPCGSAAEMLAKWGFSPAEADALQSQAA